MSQDSPSFPVTDEGRKIEGEEVVCLLKDRTSEDIASLLSVPQGTKIDKPIPSLSEGIQITSRDAISSFDGYRPGKHVQQYLLNDMPDSTPARITILISTLAGSRDASSVHSNRLLPLLNHPFLKAHKDGSPPQIETHPSTTSNFITTLAPTSIIKPALAGTPDLIILLSGDGGVIDIVDAIYSACAELSHEQMSTYKRPLIALLPCGTGNALAHSSGITADGTQGLATLMRGTPRVLPVFRVTLPVGSKSLDAEGEVSAVYEKGKVVYGAVVFSWALHATLVADSDTPAYRQHGAARFQMAANELLFPDDGKGEMHAWRGRVACCKDGKWHDLEGEEHAYVLLTLVSRLEEKFCISPESRPLDGRMRLVRVGRHKQGGTGVMDIMEMAYDGGKHVADPNVEYDELDGLRVEILEEDERWRRVCIDGKIFLVPTHCIIEVKKEEKNLVDLLVLDR